MVRNHVPEVLETENAGQEPQFPIEVSWHPTWLVVWNIFIFPLGIIAPTD
jgi:hypothetical protein